MKRLLFLLLLVSASSFGEFNPKDYEPMSYKPSMINPSQDLWKSYRFSNYSYLIKQTGCWCFHYLSKVYVITGKVTHIEVLENNPGTHPRLDTFKTIDEYFNKINKYYDETPSSFSIHHDRELGYPREFSVDPLSGSMDDEDGFTIYEVVPLIKKPHNKSKHSDADKPAPGV